MWQQIRKRTHGGLEKVRHIVNRSESIISGTTRVDSREERIYLFTWANLFSETGKFIPRHLNIFLKYKPHADLLLCKPANKLITVALSHFIAKPKVERIG